MKAAFDRCRELPYFKIFDDASLRAVIERGRWFSLSGGMELFRQGEPADAVYFVLSGRLIVVRRGEAGEEVLGYVRSGEPVGEMSLLAGESRSASVYALRDTELLAVDRADAERLLDECADFSRALAHSIVARARHPSASFKRASPRVFALIGSSPSVDVEAHAKALLRLVGLYGARAAAVGDPETLGEADFDDIENAHDVVLLTARVGESFAYRFALRHADRFFVFARQDARPPRPFPLTPTEDSPVKKFRLVDIVMLHEGMKTGSVSDWVDAVDAHRVFHVSGPRTEERLARAIAGKTVGVVMSGGGARAYAHIGAIKAIRERRIPIDFLAGASMGAIIAACVAMGWDDAEIEARIRDGFVSSNPLGDHVLPVVALTRGQRVEERLKRHFGDARIEDLEIPFFCTSSEMTRGVTRVHRRGLLRHALRASIALPGILPPVVADGELLVDGAVMNNFPTDLMTNLHRGVTIGIDVAREATISPDAFANPPRFLEWVWRHGFRSPPPIVTLLMRAATSRQELRPRDSPADILVTPDVAGVELRDWKEYDRAVIDGYAATLGALDRNWMKLAAIVEAGLPRG
ncbi:MAG: patatin-like phospholipase family protein [Parvularculaceae bacterium]|nr:patatin-like phospholipase family protein [Parvularculaceae bacterium]